MNEKIKEINQHIRDGINQWADVMLQTDKCASTFSNSLGTQELSRSSGRTIHYD